MAKSAFLSSTPRSKASAGTLRRLRLSALRILLVCALLAIWQAASGTLVPELFISSPSVIFERLGEWVANGSLFYHAGITALEAFLGFVAGGLIGVGVGVALGRSETMAELLNPFIIAFNSLPKVALAPLFILWFGIGLEMKIILTAMIVFFLVFMNTYLGVRAVSRELISILKLMGASERHLLTKVVLPSAITWVFAGLRISVPYALIGALVGEFMGSNQGLGAVLSRAQGNFDTAGVFAALAAITVLALVLNGIVRSVESWLMPWKASEEHEQRI